MPGSEFRSANEGDPLLITVWLPQPAACQFAPPGVYKVLIRAAGGAVRNQTLEVRIQASASLYGNVGVPGAASPAPTCNTPFAFLSATQYSDLKIRKSKSPALKPATPAPVMAVRPERAPRPVPNAGARVRWPCARAFSRWRWPVLVAKAGEKSFRVLAHPAEAKAECSAARL